MLIYIRNFGSSEFNGTGPASKKTAKRCFLSFSLKLRSNVKQKIFSAFDVAAADEKTIIFSLWMNEMNGDEFRLKRNCLKRESVWPEISQFGLLFYGLARILKFILWLAKFWATLGELFYQIIWSHWRESCKVCCEIFMNSRGPVGLKVSNLVSQKPDLLAVSY